MGVPFVESGVIARRDDRARGDRGVIPVGKKCVYASRGGCCFGEDAGWYAVGAAFCGDVTPHDAQGRGGAEQEGDDRESIHSEGMQVRHRDT